MQRNQSAHNAWAGKEEPIYESPLVSFSKRGPVLNHSCENEFNFTYERMSTRTRFENEAKDNLEMGYYHEKKNKRIYEFTFSLDMMHSAQHKALKWRKEQITQV